MAWSVHGISLAREQVVSSAMASRGGCASTENVVNGGQGLWTGVESQSV